MASEITRRTWKQFLKRFSAKNRYRSLRVKTTGEQLNPLTQDSPFMGFGLRKKGRFISGVSLYTGITESEKIAEPVLTIDDPKSISLEKDIPGQESHLLIQSKDGTKIRFELEGTRDISQPENLIKRVAYKLYQQHGNQHGNDLADWLDAEQQVKEVEKLLSS